MGGVYATDERQWQEGVLSRFGLRGKGKTGGRGRCEGNEEVGGHVGPGCREIMLHLIFMRLDLVGVLDGLHPLRAKTLFVLLLPIECEAHLLNALVSDTTIQRIPLISRLVKCSNGNGDIVHQVLEKWACGGKVPRTSKAYGGSDPGGRCRWSTREEGPLAYGPILQSKASTRGQIVLNRCSEPSCGLQRPNISGVKVGSSKPWCSEVGEEPSEEIVGERKEPMCWGAGSNLCQGWARFECASRSTAAERLVRWNMYGS